MATQMGGHAAGSNDIAHSDSDSDVIHDIGDVGGVLNPLVLPDVGFSFHANPGGMLCDGEEIVDIGDDVGTVQAPVTFTLDFFGEVVGFDQAHDTGSVEAEQVAVSMEVAQAAMRVEAQAAVSVQAEQVEVTMEVARAAIRVDALVSHDMSFGAEFLRRRAAPGGAGAMCTERPVLNVIADLDHRLLYRQQAR